LGLLEGCDSTTSAILVNRAVGESLLCVLVDTDYMRKNEVKNNERLLRKLGLNVLVLDAKKGSTTS
jgi:GMP synthase (glutamine-hydrolysing)